MLVALVAPVARVTGRGVWRGDRHVARPGRRSAVNRDFVVVAPGVVAAAQRDRDGCTAPDCRGNASCGSSVAREFSTAQPTGRRLGRAAGREGVRARHAAEGAALFVDANVASAGGASKEAGGHSRSMRQGASACQRAPSHLAPVARIGGRGSLGGPVRQRLHRSVERWDKRACGVGTVDAARIRYGVTRLDGGAETIAGQEGEIAGVRGTSVITRIVRNESHVVLAGASPRHCDSAISNLNFVTALGGGRSVRRSHEGATRGGRVGGTRGGRLGGACGGHVGGTRGGRVGGGGIRRRGLVGF
jgi:hypothetical protein